jgi:hypothetical protein
VAAGSELLIRPVELSYRILREPPDDATPEAAAQAVAAWVRRTRPGLSGLLHITTTPSAVRVRAWGEYPDVILVELADLLGLHESMMPQGILEVNADEFTVEVSSSLREADVEREVLRSRVRHFPYPICEWFDISTGMLCLTDTRVLFESEHFILSSPVGPSCVDALDISLDCIQRVWRGEWWDIPCLMIQTAESTHRFGWPAERTQIETEFDVSEWINALRALNPREMEA